MVKLSSCTLVSAVHDHVAPLACCTYARALRIVATLALGV